ncbi:hypothetical protein A9R05_12670 [Burkholderia sp. KK1]|nr:hypothetical protein A9R05_12670 [Burkholderia sp. KK1]
MNKIDIPLIFQRDPALLVLDAFVAFLCEAAAARKKNDARAFDIWVKAATRLHPVDLDSITGLINALNETQDFERALSLSRVATDLLSRSAHCLFLVGLTLQLSQRQAEAIAPYREALSLEPDLPNLRNNLAAALIETQTDLSEAAELLEAALAHDPTDGNGWLNLGKIHLLNFDLEKALAAGESALRLQPENPTYLSNQSQRLREAQAWDAAERYANLACRLAPDNATYRFNLGLIHLMRGNYTDGWREHEFRWNGSKELAGKRPVLPSPTWRGEPLAGKTLLLWGEQGMGDLLQFCRFVPLLAERVHGEGGRLVWNSFPHMGGLLQRSLARYADEFSLGGGVDSLPAFDYEISLLTLPLIFETREANIPRNVPYLYADELKTADWRARLNGSKNLKVGLAWTGSRDHQRNPYRRVPIGEYAAHFSDIPNVTFYSLQPGADDDIAAARAARLDIKDYSAEFRTFDDTAAFVESMDLVISVCTSVAHLCGALGQKTWVLLDVNPHWVWLLDRADNPWYPTATLYRQSKFADWDPVLRSVRADLMKVAAANR